MRKDAKWPPSRSHGTTEPRRKNFNLGGDVPAKFEKLNDAADRKQGKQHFGPSEIDDATRSQYGRVRFGGR